MPCQSDATWLLSPCDPNVRGLSVRSLYYISAPVWVDNSNTWKTRQTGVAALSWYVKVNTNGCFSPRLYAFYALFADQLCYNYPGVAFYRHRINKSEHIATSYGWQNMLFINGWIWWRSMFHIQLNVKQKPLQMMYILNKTYRFFSLWRCTKQLFKVLHHIERCTFLLM